MARPANAPLGGKCDARLDVPLTTELYESIGVLATLAGQTRSAYVRELLDRHVYGELAGLQARLRRRGAGDDGTNSG